MPSNLQQFKEKAFAKPGVRTAYEELAEEFASLEEALTARQDGPEASSGRPGTSRNRK